LWGLRSSEDKRRKTYTQNVGEVFRRFSLVLDDTAKFWKSIFDLQDLLQLFVVLHDDNLTTGVLEHIMASVGRVGRVYADRKPSVKHVHILVR